MSNFSRPGGSVDRSPADEAAGQASFGLFTLIELFDGDHAAIVNLLSAAIVSIARDVDAIDAAVRARDAATIVEIAHRIRGTSGTIGAAGLIAVSARIEAAATQSPDAVTAALRADLRAVVDRVSADITAYTARRD